MANAQIPALSPAGCVILGDFLKKKKFIYLAASNLSCGASQLVLAVKNLPANTGDMRHGFDPWVAMIPWRRAWQHIPVFLSRESYGQRDLVGYSPQGHQELDMTEVT